MRVAIIHDWLVTWRGGEKCLRQIRDMYPDVTVYTLFTDEQLLENYLSDTKVKSALLNRLPFVSRYYRLLLLLFPLDILFLSWRLRRDHSSKPYDLVISISHCAVKNVTPPEGVPHVCYCLTPMRYIWDQYDRYLSGVWYEPLFRPIRLLLQKWDVYGAKKVTHFIAISSFISQRILKCYGRGSSVVYPPVKTGQSSTRGEQEDRKNPKALAISASKQEEVSFLMVNALVPYKNTKLIVESFRDLPYNLRIVGEGPEKTRLSRMAGENVTFLGRISDEELAREYELCKALIFAAEEDFGIVPVESQDYGKPVICYAEGGCLETVILNGDKRTGGAFYRLEVTSVRDAIKEFLINEPDIETEHCKENAKRFSEQAFDNNFKEEVRLFLRDFHNA